MQNFLLNNVADENDYYVEFVFTLGIHQLM